MHNSAVRRERRQLGSVGMYIRVHPQKQARARYLDASSLSYSMVPAMQRYIRQRICGSAASTYMDWTSNNLQGMSRHRGTFLTMRACSRKPDTDGLAFIKPFVSLQLDLTAAKKKTLRIRDIERLFRIPHCTFCRAGLAPSLKRQRLRPIGQS